MIKRKTVLSGVQPTGNLHLGNYLGSIVNWLKMQDDYHCFFGIMNMHSITIYQEPEQLRQNIYKTLASYIACGLNSSKSVIFLQSDISEHSELAWLLGTIAPLGWLNRMTQFKEKKDNGKNGHNNENLGLYSYPILMASDILLYNADLVPVGEDQKQHLELTRDLANNFNRIFKNNFFTLPEPIIIKETKRIMSLQDASKKMSKSDNNDNARINLDDDESLIIKKIKRAKTDSSPNFNYHPHNENNSPEVVNLVNIFSAIANISNEKIANDYQNLSYGKFKNDLAEIIVARIKPIQQNINNLLADKNYLNQILKQGAISAKDVANQNLKKIYSIIGFN